MTIIQFVPGLRPVLKHGSHDQSTHGRRGGGAREVNAKDVDSAWDAVLSDEARTIDNPKKAHPEKYDSRGKLKDGEVETRRVQGEGPPRVRDYETNESAGLSWSEAAKVEGALGLSQTGDFTMRVPIGPERPPQHVYRVMSTEEFDQARQRGYIKSDERMNLASGEGTVTSLRSTGDFYAPVDGSDYRVVRIKYDDADGWRTDTIDSYIKTQERVPFDRVDLYSSPLTNPRVVKHGSHDQSTHNPHKGGASDLPEGWSQKSREELMATYERKAIDEWGASPEKAKEFAAKQADAYDVFEGANGSTVRIDKYAEIPKASQDRLLKQVDEMQAVAPRPGMTVEVGTSAFRYHGLDPRSTGAFAILGEPEIYMAPRSVTKGFKADDPDWFMPSAKKNVRAYPLAHEWGHTLDQRRIGKANNDHNIVAKGGGLSEYGKWDSRESFAESFAEWHLTGGRSTNPAVQYFSETYNWGSEGGVPVAKAVGPVIIVADTFVEGEPPIMREVTPPNLVDWVLDQPVKKAVTVRFEPGIRPVLKHGDHDQSTHGRRGGSSMKMGEGVAESIVERVRANGGLSVNMIDGSEPTKGYMVAKGGTKGAIMDADEFYDPVKGPEALGSFFKAHKSELTGGDYLGVWDNKADGKVYLDLSENIMDRSTAISEGRKRDQISIWDVTNFEEIDTGGTGQLGKSVADDQIAGHLEDDGRGDRRIRKDTVGEDQPPVIVRFEPGLRPVLKHGDHDQSTHGRRGSRFRSEPGESRLTLPPSTSTVGRLVDSYFLSDAEYDAMEREASSLIFGGPDPTIAFVVDKYYDAKESVQAKLKSVAERLGLREPDPPQMTSGERVRAQLENWAKYGAPSGVESLDPPRWIANDPAFDDYVAPPLPPSSRGPKGMQFGLGPTGGMTTDTPELQALMDEFGTTRPTRGMIRPGDPDAPPVGIIRPGEL